MIIRGMRGCCGLHTGSSVVVLFVLSVGEYFLWVVEMIVKWRWWVSLVMGLLACAVVTSGKSSPSQSDRRSLFESVVEVVDLDGTSGPRDVMAGCPLLLFVYDDGCGHCRSVSRVFAGAAAVISQHAVGALAAVQVGAVNCAEYAVFCKGLNVVDLPTLRLYYPMDSVSSSDGMVTLSVFEKNDSCVVDVELQLGALWQPKKAWQLDNVARCHAQREDAQRSFAAVKRARERHEDDVAGASFVEEIAVSSTDVANAFFYTLYFEVALVGLGTEPQFTALSNFLTVVEELLPGLGSGVVKDYLQQIPVINGSGGGRIALNVTEWHSVVQRSGIPYRGTPPRLEWVTCRGSSWRYRGYPCGLWLLYHSLTATVQPREAAGILPVIQAYAREFFKCSVCRQNFLNFHLGSQEDPALQLWRVHNAVNWRLRNVSDGADPKVPKQQFPSAEMCPACIDGTEESTYNLSAVLTFLKARYTWEAVSRRDPSKPSMSRGTVVQPSPTPMATPDQRGEETALVHPNPFTLHILILFAMVVVVVCISGGCAYVVRAARRRRVHRNRKGTLSPRRG